MSRDTEKLLKELQSFLMQHGDEAADEDSMDRLAEQFLSEQGIHPVDENAAPKTADDYLDLAEQKEVHRVSSQGAGIGAGQC